MAPERLRASPYGKSSDIWSVGLVLLECVSGCSPWQDVKSLVDLVVTVEEVDENSLIPDNITRGLQEILLGCLRKEPGTTYTAVTLSTFRYYEWSNSYSYTTQRKEFRPVC
jgi:serine/threonine protein kinase